MKLKEKSPQKNVVAETFYLYTEHDYPQKKKRSWLPLWILVGILWTATFLLTVPRVQNFVMEKILPPEIHYRLLEQRYINNANKNPVILPDEFVFSLSGTAHDDLLKDLPEKIYRVKNPVDFTAEIQSAEGFIKNPAGTISRESDGENTIFTVIFSEDSALYGTEMTVTAAPDGDIFGRTFSTEKNTVGWQDASDSSHLNFSFRYENDSEYFDLSVNGAATPGGYAGTALINSSEGIAEISFENFSADQELEGTFRLVPQNKSDASAEMTLSGTLQKPSAEVVFMNGSDKLISYTLSRAESENSSELTFTGILDSFRKLAEVKEFSPDNTDKSSEHTCVRSVDLTMSKIKIGKKYIGLPSLLENLPELFDLEGEIIQPGKERMFVTDNREVVILMKNYNDKPEDAMKCGVTMIIVNGCAGNKLWELKLNGIGIGNTERQTVTVLGQPSRIEDIGGKEVYCYHDCENDIEFRFKFENGMIIQNIFSIGK